MEIWVFSVAEIPKKHSSLYDKKIYEYTMNNIKKKIQLKNQKDFLFILKLKSETKSIW